MKQLNLIILVSTILTFNLIGQDLAHAESVSPKFFQNTSNPDTSIVNSSDDSEIDGQRTEIKSQKTGAKKADKDYRNLGFKTSVNKYLKEMDGEKLTKEKMFRLANSFRLNSQTEEAEYWYSQVITDDSNAKHILRYAQVLQSNGKCEDATRWYKRFNKVASRKERKNREVIIDCEELKSIKNHETVVLKNVRALNTQHLDFSPIPYKNGVIFSTTRKNSKPKEVIDSWTDDNFSDLFYSEYSEEMNRFKRPVPLKGDLNKQFHDGVATFDPSGMMMFFTRNNRNGKAKSKDGLIDLKVYSAVYDGEYWTNVTELPFNSNEFTSCHPTLSDDGKRLYFASNRPGGFGGLDIYVSENKGGLWQDPTNLGPTVNSAGNEIFPVMHDNETLYYSSNGHQGLGGLDIFKANKTDLKDETSWTVRENLGTPFNSLKDDFGFVLINDGTHTGFLTSNREGGKGKDDIYTWTMDGELEEDGPMLRTICVYDEKTGDRLDNAMVTIIEKSMMDGEEENDDLMLTLQPLDENEDKGKYILGITGKNKNKEESKLMDFTTDAEGVFTYTAKPGKQYAFKVERKGYDNHDEKVTYRKLKESNEYCLPMNRKNCRVMAGLVVNKAYGKAMPDAVVEVWNKCTNQKDKFTTDATGTFDICVPCGCEYRIHATKSGFDSDTEFISTVDLDCTDETPVNAKLELGVRKVVATPYVEPKPVPTVPVTTYQEVVTYVPQTKLVPVTTHVPITEVPNYNNTHVNYNNVHTTTTTTHATSTITNPNLGVGNVISLQDVYYNFDKYDIREDASKDLDHLYNLMVQYPSLEVELMSHTDSRGSNAYNKTLSANRANAAMQYLIKRGIAAHRMTSNGYGETQLKNRCADGTECTEVEHQQNRRTEVKVTKFNSPGTTIQGH